TVNAAPASPAVESVAMRNVTSVGAAKSDAGAVASRWLASHTPPSTVVPSKLAPPGTAQSGWPSALKSDAVGSGSSNASRQPADATHGRVTRLHPARSGAASPALGVHVTANRW